jgi:hypothetical protein
MVDKVADLAISNGLMCCQQATTAATAAASVAASTSTAVSNGVEREAFSAMSIVVAVRELLDPLRQLLLGMSLMREKTPQVSIHVTTYRHCNVVPVQYSYVYSHRLFRMLNASIPYDSQSIIASAISVSFSRCQSSF